MTYVEWFNHRRLHGSITPGPGYTTPAAHESAYYRQTTPAPEPVTQ
jgi:transposase InsO family protein